MSRMKDHFISHLKPSDEELNRLEGILNVDIKFIAEKNEVSEMTARYILRRVYSGRKLSVTNAKLLKIVENTIQIESEVSNDFLKLSSITDYVPFKSIRKKQRKLIADEYAEISELSKKGEASKIRWRLFWIKVHWLRYLLSYPASAIFKLAKKLIA